MAIDIWSDLLKNDSTIEIQREANVEYICSYLVSQGFTKQAACGIIGNMQGESQFNPGIWQSANSLTSGYGLVQWTPATVFLDRAVSTGTLSAATAAAVNALTTNNPKALMNAELDCLIWCCTSRGDFSSPSTHGYTQHLAGYDSMTFAQFKASTLSAYDLAIIWNDHYERSGDSLAAIEANRAAPADTWYNTI